MKFSVTKSAQGMVLPADPTPRETLDLSDVDRLPGMNAKVKSFHVFRRGHKPARVVKEALSRALVHYYPFAGRLRESSEGEVQIACTGEGVWFVEASADCCMEDAAEQLDLLFMASSDHGLLPSSHAPDGLDLTNVIALMQVTEFVCGGFVVAFESCHCMSDGMGAAQFLFAVGELARGLQDPTLKPVWSREAIPTLGKPPTFPTTKLELPGYRLTKAVLDITQDTINNIKNQFLELSGQRCSTFDVLAAKVWQCRTRAIMMDPSEETKLQLVANARRFIQPPLPDGFYGNCLHCMKITAPCKDLLRASVVEVVKLVKQGKAKVAEEFAGWAEGNWDESYLPTISYASVLMIDWRKLGFNDVDYSWGTPTQISGLPLLDIVPVCIPVQMPTPRKGVRLLTCCVEEVHLAAFTDQVTKENA